MSEPFYDLRVKLAALGDDDHETLAKAETLIYALEGELERLQQQLDQYVATILDQGPKP